MRQGIRELKGHPLTGHLSDFRERRLDLLRRVRAECGDLGFIRLGPLRALIVSSPELAREILTERHGDFSRVPLQGMDGVKRLFGAGMLVRDGETHRAQRKRAAAALSRARMAALAPQVIDEVEVSLRDLRTDDQIDLYAEVLSLTIRVTQRVLFGAAIRVGDGLGMAELLSEVVRCALHEIGRPLPLPGWVPTAHNRAFRRAIAALDAAIFEVIRLRRSSGSNGQDVLSLFLAADPDAEPLADRELRDDLIALFVAGHEAMATTLFWCIYECERDRALGANLRREIRDKVGGARVSANDVARVPLALQIFRESMRYYPANHIIVRRAARDLELGGAALRAGTMVLLNGYSIQRDAACFVEPERFMPERFADASDKELAGVYFPFGAGPRTCVGNHFALTYAPLMLMQIVRSLEFEPLASSAPQIATGFALYPRGGFQVKIRRQPPT